MSFEKTSRIIAVTNQKGGVGKTTTAIHITQALAALGYSVLLLDLDPQGNATEALGLKLQNLKISAVDLLKDKSLPTEGGIYQGPGFDLIPATPQLAYFEREMSSITNSELRLAQRLKALKDRYSFIIIDNAPGFGPLMNSAFNAAHSILVPVDSSFFGMSGIQKLLGEMEVIKEGYNPSLSILGFVLTLFDCTKLSDEIRDELTSTFGDLVFKTPIRRSIKLREAPLFGRTVFQHAPGSSGAEDYLALTQEILSRVQLAQNSTSHHASPRLQVVTHV